jgi:hypothetical protein
MSEKNILSTDTITFGKYKNNTIETVLKDRPYCKWLLKQNWFLTNYEYLYNRVLEYNPLDFFIKKRKTEVGDSGDPTFLETYPFFLLKHVDEIKLILSENEKKCYLFYTKTIQDLKQKITDRIDTANMYNIKAPTKWLQNFEKETELKREEFRVFIDSYELLNITYIVEDIKKQGGIVYKGAQSFNIAKKRSVEQESFWENILKKKYGEDIGTQFKYEKCIFDFINISTNTIYECKLNLCNFNTVQHKKYLLTLKQYSIVYLINKDCVINMTKKEIYTTNPDKYVVEINLLHTNKLVEIIKDYIIIEIEIETQHSKGAYPTESASEGIENII